jgi:hypothetical protein
MLAPQARGAWLSAVRGIVDVTGPPHPKGKRCTARGKAFTQISTRAFSNCVLGP